MNQKDARKNILHLPRFFAFTEAKHASGFRLLASFFLRNHPKKGEENSFMKLRKVYMG